MSSRNIRNSLLSSLLKMLIEEEPDTLSSLISPASVTVDRRICGSADLPSLTKVAKLFKICRAEDVSLEPTRNFAALKNSFSIYGCKTNCPSSPGALSVSSAIDASQGETIFFFSSRLHQGAEGACLVFFIPLGASILKSPLPVSAPTVLLNPASTAAARLNRV